MSRFASDGPYAEEEFGQRSICFCVVTVYIKTKSRRVYLKLYIFTLFSNCRMLQLDVQLFHSASGPVNQDYDTF